MPQEYRVTGMPSAELGCPGPWTGDGLCWVSPKQNRDDGFLYVVAIPLGIQPKKTETSHDILETQ